MSKVVKLPDICTVRLEDELIQSDDFIAILAKEDGNVTIYYNTDALTLGLAFKLVLREFVTCLRKCSEEEQEIILDILDLQVLLNGLEGYNE